MAMKFSPAEVMEMAVELEKRGMVFYQNLYENSRDVSSKEIFSFLQKEEERHFEYFTDMIKNLGEVPTHYEIMDETTEYLGAVIEGGVLGKVLKGVDLTGGDTSLLRALDVGIEVEKESIIFYQGMEPMIPEGKIDILRQIILEEQRHFLKLTKMKEEHSS